MIKIKGIIPDLRKIQQKEGVTPINKNEGQIWFELDLE